MTSELRQNSISLLLAEVLAPEITPVHRLQEHVRVWCVLQGDLFSQVWVTVPEPLLWAWPQTAVGESETSQTGALSAKS